MTILIISSIVIIVGLTLFVLIKTHFICDNIATIVAEITEKRVADSEKKERDAEKNERDAYENKQNLEKKLNKLLRVRRILQLLERSANIGGMYWLFIPSDQADGYNKWVKVPKREDLEQLINVCEWSSDNNYTIGVTKDGVRILIHDGVYKTQTTINKEIKTWKEDKRRKDGGFCDVHYREKDIYCVVEKGQISFVDEDLVPFKSKTELKYIYCFSESLLIDNTALGKGLPQINSEIQDVENEYNQSKKVYKECESQHRECTKTDGKLSRAEIRDLVKENSAGIFWDKMTFSLWEVTQELEKTQKLEKVERHSDSLLGSIADAISHPHYDYELKTRCKPKSFTMLLMILLFLGADISLLFFLEKIR